MLAFIGYGIVNPTRRAGDNFCQRLGFAVVGFVVGRLPPPSSALLGAAPDCGQYGCGTQHRFNDALRELLTLTPDPNPDPEP